MKAPSDQPRDERPGEAERTIRSMSRRSFLWAGLAIAAAAAGERWLATRRMEGGIPWPLRRVSEFNEDVVQDYYSPDRLAPTFDEALRTEPTLNGDEGMKDDVPFDPAKWKLRLQGFYQPPASADATPTPATSAADKKKAPVSSSADAAATSKTPAVGKRQAANPGDDDSTDDSSTDDDSTDNSTDDSTDNNSPDDNSADNDDDSEPAGPPTMRVTMADIHKLPHAEMITEFKCVEGWSMVVHWGGVRLADFIAKYPPTPQNDRAPDVVRHPEDLPPYIAMETPDGGYYIGLDMAMALHPQTLLAYEMNGKPLTVPHGGPLRLVTPLKYGITQIKRVGLIRYTNDKPRDFWAQEGYDWSPEH